MQREAGGGAAPGGVVGERILGFGDTHRQLVEAVRFQPGNLLGCLRADFDAVRAIDFAGESLQLFHNRARSIVNGAELPRGRLYRLDQSLSQLPRSLSASCPDLVHSDAPALFPAMSDYGLHLGGRVLREPIDRDHERHPDLADIRRVTVQIGQAARHRCHIFPVELSFRDPAVHLEGADRCDQHHGVGRERGLPRRCDDVAELLKA